MKYFACLLCLGLVVSSVLGRGMKRSADSDSSSEDSDSDSPAQTTPCMCQLNYDPVCGEDGVTYNNECNLNCANAVKASDGACPGSGGGLSFPGK